MGKVFFGLEVKLSNGDEGEILVKSPHMFTESDSTRAPLKIFDTDVI